MSTTITDVTELQAMEDDLDGDYVLGNNIDASATSTWNGGLGFAPIGRGTNVYSYSYPESDDFGYAGQSGSWTIYPADGVYYDKVDEEDSDGDSTYIQATTNGDIALLAFDATALDLPDEATNIRLYLKVRLRNTASGTSYTQGMLNIDGTEYLVGSNQSQTSTSWTLKTWSIPDYPLFGFEGWTVGQVFSLATAGIGVKVSDASPDVRITQIYLQIAYDLIFTGTFDGAEYTISDLYINRPTEYNVGLFGYADLSTIEDVTLSGVDITGYDYTGGLLGWAGGCTIANCHTAGSVNGGSYAYEVCGLIGETDENDDGGTDTTLENCSSTCTVTGTDDEYDCNKYGGLIGECDKTSVTECYATGNVSDADDYAGGLIGYANSVDILNCYARGNVTGNISIGGLVGRATSNTTITNCFSTGAPIGNDDVGGLVGYTTITAINSFWDTTTSGTETSDGGTGYATATMLLFATYGNAGWDIGQADATRNDGYPFLSWEIDESATIWQIFGEVTYSISSSVNFPDLMDDKGRHPKNARVRAYRVDTHSLVDEQYTDHNGTVTFDKLPAGVDVIFLATWGGISQPDKQRWFFLQVYDVDGGGTGAGTAAGALSNLGLGTEDSPQFTAVNLGHDSDTTITRVDSGRIAIEGVNIVRSAGTVADNEIVRFSGTTGDLVK